MLFSINSRQLKIQIMHRGAIADEMMTLDAETVANRKVEMILVYKAV